MRQGKVRYIGCSNFASWQLMKALAISNTHNWEKFVTLEALYSLLVREVEYELVPLCLDQGLGLLTWSPLAGGVLSGKYHQGNHKPTGARFSDTRLGFDEKKVNNIIDELDKIAKRHNATITQTSLNYLLCKPSVTSVVVGIRTPDQITDNLKTAEWEMLPEEVIALDKISAPTPIYPHDFLSHAPND